MLILLALIAFLAATVTKHVTRSHRHRTLTRLIFEAEALRLQRTGAEWLQAIRAERAEQHKGDHLAVLLADIEQQSSASAEPRRSGAAPRRTPASRESGALQLR